MYPTGHFIGPKSYTRLLHSTLNFFPHTDKFTHKLFSIAFAVIVIIKANNMITRYSLQQCTQYWPFHNFKTVHVMYISNGKISKAVLLRDNTMHIEKYNDVYGMR